MNCYSPSREIFSPPSFPKSIWQGKSASAEMGVRGLAFVIAETSAIKVESTLWVIFEGLIWESMESSILRHYFVVPQSDQITFTGPRTAKKCLRALIKLDVPIDSMSSISTARMLRHVKSTVHLLLFAAPLWVRWVEMVLGPNTSRPMFVKGGSMLRRSDGRSAIFCSTGLSRSLLHMIHVQSSGDEFPCSNDPDASCTDCSLSEDTALMCYSFIVVGYE